MTDEVRKDGYYVVILKDKDNQLFMSRCYSFGGKLYLIQHELFRQRFRYIYLPPSSVHEVIIDSYQSEL